MENDEYEHLDSKTVERNRLPIAWHSLHASQTMVACKIDNSGLTLTPAIFLLRERRKDIQIISHRNVRL